MKFPILLTATALLGLVPYSLANNLVANPGFEKLQASWSPFAPEDEMKDWGLDDSDPHAGGDQCCVISLATSKDFRNSFSRGNKS